MPGKVDVLVAPAAAAPALLARLLAERKLAAGARAVRAAPFLLG